jgi:hypothetical protein
MKILQSSIVVPILNEVDANTLTSKFSFGIIKL